jgi:hypothetical protein
MYGLLKSEVILESIKETKRAHNINESLNEELDSKCGGG